MLKYRMIKMKTKVPSGSLPMFLEVKEFKWVGFLLAGCIIFIKMNCWYSK